MDGNQIFFYLFLFIAAQTCLDFGIWILDFSFNIYVVFVGWFDDVKYIELEVTR